MHKEEPSAGAATEFSGRERALTERWIERLAGRRAILPRGDEPCETARRHIPAIVAWIGRQLDEPGGPRVDMEILSILRDYTRERREQGFDVQELLAEFEELGSVLADVLAASGASPERVARLVEIMLSVATITAGLYREAEMAERRERSQTMERFARTLAHEIKNPLSAAQGAAELLEEERTAGDPGSRRQFVEMIQRNLHRARELVDDVQSLVFAEGPRLRITLREAIEGVIARIGTTATERGVRILTDPEIPDLLVDRARIDLALDNLAWNAVKYADPGKTDRWVRIGVTRDEEEAAWRVVVEDNGIGIPEDQQPHVFERFYQGHGRVGDGSGLGLAIAREAVEQMGGRIGLESTEGVGTTVYFTIPDRGEWATRERGEGEKRRADRESRTSS